MRVSIFSHSYTVRENQKNIDALAAHVDLNVLIPHKIADRIFETVRFDKPARGSGIYHVHRRLGLLGAQYLLLSRDLGFRTFHPDLIQVEYDPWSAIFWQALAYRKAFAPRAKVVSVVKNNTYRRYPGLRGRMKFGVACAGIRRVDHFIAASHAVAELYQQKFAVAADDIRVMQHLGVDTELFSPRPTPPEQGEASGTRVGYCGRLDQGKGVNELFEAVRTIRERDDLDLRLDFLGDGQLRDRFVGLSRENDWFQLRPRVPHDQVPAFLGTLDLFVLPTRVSERLREHDAHALLEAMAMGLPCLGTRSGITPEILEDGSGLLVYPNSVAELRRGLLALASDPRLCDRLRKKARKKAAAAFSVEAVAAQRVQLYQEVVDAGRTQGN